MKRMFSDFAGAFGDLGTLLPLAVGLIAFCGMNPMIVFLSAGVFYIIAAINFKIPMPVQPLKALCAIAIATKASADQVAAATFLMGIMLLALGVLPVTGLFKTLFTRPVVRGIQLALGYILAKTGFTYVIGAKLFLDAGSGTKMFSFHVPSFSMMAAVATAMVVPQITLTIGNSVVATADAAKKYFGERANRVTPRRIMLSLGIANICSSLISGLPMCHGAAGLTAHFKSGARTAACGVIIGAALVAIAIVFGSKAAHAVSVIPLPILGAMLMYVGCQHMLLARDVWGTNSEFAIAVLICILSAALGNLAYAAAVGIAIDKTLAFFRKDLVHDNV